MMKTMCWIAVMSFAPAGAFAGACCAAANEAARDTTKPHESVRETDMPVESPSRISISRARGGITYERVPQNYYRIPRLRKRLSSPYRLPHVDFTPEMTKIKNKDWRF